MKTATRLPILLLLLTLCLTLTVGCTTPAPDGEGTTAPSVTTEKDTEASEPKLTLDNTYRIIISAEADEITQKTAEMVAGVIREVVGFELTVATDAESAADKELVLGHTNRAPSADDEEAYRVFVNGDSLYLDASDSITLYFAAEAVLTTWLTADFGLSEAGTVTLPESRVAELNGLTTKRDNSIKVMTQNMRYADDANGNTVQKRSERFGQLLNEYQPDLIGTQEYNSNWSIRVARMLEAGTIPAYGTVGYSREGKDKTGGEFNLILYRTDRFELLESDTFWLSDTPEVASKVESSIDKRICTWALLKDLRTGETILFANTHLDHSTDEVRGEQMAILMNILAERIGDYPVYLTGDFNCTSDSAPYDTVTATLSDAHKTAWVDRSTVDHTYHDYSEYGSEIDFIFHNDDTTPIQYEILSKQYGGYVSDHYGVIVEFIND